MEQNYDAHTLAQAAKVMSKIADAYISYTDCIDREENGGWLTPQQYSEMNQEKVLVEHNYDQAYCLYDLDQGAFLEKYRKYADASSMDILLGILIGSETGKNKGEEK